MPNMDYCMFENTYADLKECEQKLSQSEDKDLSVTELEYKNRLLELCLDIVE